MRNILFLRTSTENLMQINYLKRKQSSITKMTSSHDLTTLSYGIISTQHFKAQFHNQ